MSPEPPEPSKFVYARPTTLPAALALRAGGATVLAGATDVYPVRVGGPLRTPADGTVLDITALADLKGIVRTGSLWRIGAATTWTQIAEAPQPPLFDALRQAAREVGGRQIQNRGTIGGNICNASPAADGVPPLLALDAEVELASAAGTRTLPLTRFILGPRKTALAPDEIATALLIPDPDDSQSEIRSAFLKLGARSSLVISIVMLAGCLRVHAGRIVAVRVAVGAAGPVACRLPALEATLIGAPATPDLAARVTAAHLAPLDPIDDVRATAGYRREAALALVQRLIDRLAAAS